MRVHVCVKLADVSAFRRILEARVGIGVFGKDTVLARSVDGRVVQHLTRAGDGGAREQETMSARDSVRARSVRARARHPARRQQGVDCI